MRLSDTSIGDEYIIKSIELDENVKRRFQVLGMTSGTKVSVLNKKRCGAMIIKVRGTRFAVGGAFAAGIMVGGASRCRKM